MIVNFSNSHIKRILKIDRRVGAALAESRIAAGISIADLAQRLQLPEIEIERWESGFGGYHKVRAGKLFRALNFSKYLELNCLMNELIAERKQITKPVHIIEPPINANALGVAFRIQMAA